VAASENEEALLKSCYLNSLTLAEENGAATIAFPSISTGVYRFPIERASRIAVRTVRDYLKGSKAITAVYFVCFSASNLDVYKKVLEEESK